MRKIFAAVLVLMLTALAWAAGGLLYDLSPEQIGRVIIVHPWGVMRVEPDANNDGIPELARINGGEQLPPHISLGEDIQPMFTRRFFTGGVELRQLASDGRWQSLDTSASTWLDIELLD